MTDLFRPPSDTQQGRWDLAYQARPWTLNSERGQSHWSTRAGLTKEWRRAFWVLALEQRIPPLAYVHLTVVQHCRTRQLPDVVSVFPGAKAAIDGAIKDAKVCPDDSPAYVRRVTFEAPETTGVDELVLVVEGPVATTA